MKKQQGFSILTLLIAAVAIFGILSAIVSLSRSGATVSSDSLKPLASAIITQGTNLATAYQSATSRGIANTDIAYDATTNGLLNPANTGLSPQTPPSNAFTTPTTPGAWVYKGKGLTGNTVGTSAVDYGFVLGGLSAGVCAEINKQLGVSSSVSTDVLSDAYVASGVASAATTATATTIDLSAVAAATNFKPAFTGLMQGCIKGTSGSTHYFYFVIIEPV